MKHSGRNVLDYFKDQFKVAGPSNLGARGVFRFDLLIERVLELRLGFKFLHSMPVNDEVSWQSELFDGADSQRVEQDALARVANATDARIRRRSPDDVVLTLLGRIVVVVFVRLPTAVEHDAVRYREALRAVAREF